MQLNKEYLILAGFFGLFILYYLFGWVFDNKFREVMRKTKISSVKKIFLHFKGTKMKEDRGHAVVCVRAEAASFVNLILGAVCFSAVKVTGNLKVFLASAGLAAMSFIGFVYLAYYNIGKYKSRQDRISDETNFEEYHSPVAVAQAPKQASYPNIRNKTVSTSTAAADSLESGREYMKNRGILDDDIFSPFGADNSSKFRNNPIKSNFAEESDIAKGKEALRDLAGKQLNTEGYKHVNSFDSHVNSYGSANKKSSEPAKTVNDIINEHKQDIDPINRMKAVNNYSPVRKDDNR